MDVRYRAVADAIPRFGPAAEHIEMSVGVKLRTLLWRQPLPQKRYAACLTRILAANFMEAVAQNFTREL